MINIEMKVNGLKNVIIDKIEEMLEDDFYSSVDYEIIRTVIRVINDTNIIDELIDVADTEIKNGENLSYYEKLLNRLTTEKSESKREIIAYMLKKEIEEELMY